VFLAFDASAGSSLFAQHQTSDELFNTQHHQTGRSSKVKTRDLAVRQHSLVEQDMFASACANKFIWHVNYLSIVDSIIYLFAMTFCSITAKWASRTSFKFCCITWTLYKTHYTEFYLTKDRIFSITSFVQRYTLIPGSREFMETYADPMTRCINLRGIRCA